jgi:4-diphosphocytidyl-2-C-methyl-D-erythritol kinase
VYVAWDHLGGPRGDGDNDLEPAAISAFPELAIWRDRIRESAGVAPELAGSGATWFLRGHHDLDAALADALVVHATAIP